MHLICNQSLAQAADSGASYATMAAAGARETAEQAGDQHLREGVLICHFDKTMMMSAASCAE